MFDIFFVFCLTKSSPIYSIPNRTIMLVLCLMIIVAEKCVAFWRITWLSPWITKVIDILLYIFFCLRGTIITKIMIILKETEIIDRINGCCSAVQQHPAVLPEMAQSSGMCILGAIIKFSWWISPVDARKNHHMISHGSEIIQRPVCWVRCPSCWISLISRMSHCQPKGELWGHIELYWVHAVHSSQSYFEHSIHPIIQLLCFRAPLLAPQLPSSPSCTQERLMCSRSKSPVCSP